MVQRGGQGVKTGQGFASHADAHGDLTGNGAVAPQPAAIGDIAGKAGGHFVQAIRGFGPLDKAGYAVPVLAHQVVGVGAGWRAGKQNVVQIQKTQAEAHGQRLGVGVELGGVGGLDVGDFLALGVGGGAFFGIAVFVDVLRAAYAVTHHHHRRLAVFTHIEKQCIADDHAALKSQHARQFFECKLTHDIVLYRGEIGSDWRTTNTSSCSQLCSQKGNGRGP